MTKRTGTPAGEPSARRSVILRRIFLTYCLLLFVIFVMLFPMYNSIIRSEQQRNLSGYHTTMETGYGQMVSNLNNSVLQLSTLGYGSTLERLAFISDRLTTQQYWYLREALQSLSHLTRQNDMVREAMIFFRDNGVILTTRRAYTREQPFYNEKFFYFEDLDESGFGELREACLTYSKITFLQTRKVFLGEQGLADVIICYVPIPIGGQSSGLCGAFLFLDARETIRQMDPAQKGDIHMLMDGQGGLFHIDGYPRDEALRLIGRVRDGRVTLNGITYDAFSVSTSVLQLTGYCFTDIRQYAAQTSRALRYVILSVMAAMSAGIAISIWLTHMQYAPIKRLRQAISSDAAAQNSGVNEFNEFLDAYMEIRQSNEIYRMKIQEYGRKLTENEFESMLHGRAESAEAGALADRIPALRGLFRIVVMSFGSGSGETAPYEDSALDVLKELARRFWPEDIYIHRTPRGLVLMIIPNDPPEEDRMFERIEWLGYHAGERLDAKTMVTVSRVCSAPDDIHDAYQRLISMQNAHIWSAEKGLTQVFFDHGQRCAQNALLLNEYKEAQLAALIESGNGEGAEALISGLIQLCAPDSEDCVQLFYSIRALLLEKCHMLNPEGELDIPSYQPAGARVDSLREITLCCKNLCGMYLAQNKANDLPFDEQMTAYIDTHYSDPELYGKAIANQFGLSEKYLYTYFKKHTGVGLSEYLAAARLKEAARLLSGTDISIQDIAIRVGFSSHNTFYKAFKRYYGRTPSEYRAQCAETPAE